MNIEKAPVSAADEPMLIMWLAMRCSSHTMTRRYSARSGTRIPASRSTARQYAQFAYMLPDVVEPVGERHDLQVGAVLGHLLDAAVQVADHRVDLGDHVAVEVHDHAPDAVRRRVRRADVDHQLLDRMPGVVECRGTRFDLQCHVCPPLVRCSRDAG